MVWGRFKKISFTKSRPVVGGNEFQHHSGQTQVFQGGGVTIQTPRIVFCVCRKEPQSTLRTGWRTHRPIAATAWVLPAIRLLHLSWPPQLLTSSKMPTRPGNNSCDTRKMIQKQGSRKIIDQTAAVGKAVFNMVISGSGTLNNSPAKTADYSSGCDKDEGGQRQDWNRRPPFKAGDANGPEYSR